MQKFGKFKYSFYLCLQKLMITLMSTQMMTQQIAEYFKTQPVLRAWLFGSFARGEQTEDSDVDIPEVGLLRQVLRSCRAHLNAEHSRPVGAHLPARQHLDRGHRGGHPAQARHLRAGARGSGRRRQAGRSGNVLPHAGEQEGGC